MLQYRPRQPGYRFGFDRLRFCAVAVKVIELNHIVRGKEPQSHVKGMIVLRDV